MNVDATSAKLGNFLKVGSIMTLPDGSEQLSWYGNGPVETFNDRKSNGRQGVWESNVSDQFYPYMKADDCGNLTDVKWISVKDESKRYGLMIAADGTVEASALHFTPEDLQKADHVYKLSPRKETMLSVDYGSMGTGTATCGQATLDQYRLPSTRTYNWSYTIVPVETSLSSSNITSKAAKLRSDGVAVQDKSHNALVVPVTSSASFKNTTTGNAVSGAVSIPRCTDLEKSLSGKNSFTVEVNAVPTGNPQFNMFAGKGDYAFALRAENNRLVFFVRAGGEWRQLSCDISTTDGWIGVKHQVAGIYDADNNTIKVYCDGKILGEQDIKTTDGVAASEYPLTLGACPETNRSSEAEFYEFRVYSKALSESELKSQNTASPAISPDDKCVQLWLDFDNLAENTVPEIKRGDANCDGNVDMSDVVMVMQASLNPKKYGEDGTSDDRITPLGLLNSEVDGKEGVNLNDALVIQRFSLKLIDTI